MVEGARLESVYTAKVVSRVRIPLSPHECFELVQQTIQKGFLVLETLSCSVPIVKYFFIFGLYLNFEEYDLINLLEHEKNN